MRRHRRIVEDHVIVIGAADADLVAVAAMAMHHIMVPGQDLDPHHRLPHHRPHCTASAKPRLSAMALSKLTPSSVSRETSASVLRSWVTSVTETS